MVEIHGPVKLYDNRAEIILNDLRQLKGEAAQIPPLPKTYDVEKRGRYSAGKFSYPKSSGSHLVSGRLNLSRRTIPVRQIRRSIKLRRSDQAFFSSSRGYNVPRQTTPPCWYVSNIDCSTVYENNIVLMGCNTK